MSDAGNRWVQVGQSANTSARVAGATAAQQALGRQAKLLVVFASFEYDLEDLVEGVSGVAGETPVIGCSTTGEIGPAREDAPSVVVVGLGGDFDVAVGRASGFGESPRRVGEAAVGELGPFDDRQHGVVLLLTDTLAGDQQEMLRGAYGVVGANIPLVGGGAGDDLRMVTSRQIFGRQVLLDSVVAAAIRSDGPIGVSASHGWKREGRAMTVTASRGNDVYTLDDRPALDVYLERHHAPAGVEDDREAFVNFAITRPLTMARRGQVAVRHVLSTDTTSRLLGCASTVPRGATVWLSHGDTVSALEAAGHACDEAIAGLAGSPPLGLLLFDCTGRRAVLGDVGLEQERDIIATHAGSAAIAGFYSYGEIARVMGVDGFHNQTVVALALG
jgi:hypothetical protein